MTQRDYQDADIMTIVNDTVTDTASSYVFADDVVKGSSGAAPAYPLVTPGTYKLKVLDGIITNNSGAAAEYQIIAFWTFPENPSLTYSEVLLDVFIPTDGSYAIDKNNEMICDHYSELQIVSVTASGTGTSQLRVVWVKG